MLKKIKVIMDDFIPPVGDKCHKDLKNYNN